MEISDLISSAKSKMWSLGMEGERYAEIRKKLSNLLKISTAEISNLETKGNLFTDKQSGFQASRVPRVFSELARKKRGMEQSLARERSQYSFWFSAVMLVSWNKKIENSRAKLERQNLVFFDKNP